MRGIIKLSDGREYTVDVEIEEQTEKVTGWERVKHNGNYWAIDGDSIYRYKELSTNDIEESYNIANYFSTKEKAKEVNKVQTLMRKMWRWRDENDKVELKWKKGTGSSSKYYIFYNNNDENWKINSYIGYRHIFDVYFSTFELAQQCLDIFKDELNEIKDLI